MLAPAPLRLGLVGLAFGRCLAATLANIPGARLAHVADRRHDSSELAARHGARAWSDGVAMIREAADLDAVLIATAPRARGPLLAACAARGLPVFVEKPWAAHPAQAAEFAEICAPIADRVMCGFSFRFLPAVARLRALLDDDTQGLGAPWMANGEYTFAWNLQPHFWLFDPASGGGVFNENSCHLYDTLAHLLGHPVAVQAVVANPRAMPGPELAAVTLEFASGAVAALTLGAHGAGAMSDFPRLDLVTARGRARLQGRAHVWTSLEWARHGEPESRRFETTPEAIGETRYAAALRHFIEGVRDPARRPFSAGIADGLRAVAFAAALGRSAAEQTRVVISP